MRKFYRSSKNKVISGICGGLGYHTHTDPLIWRVVFGVSGILLFPIAIITYILLTVLTEKK
jgi:phage shock protein C